MTEHLITLQQIRDQHPCEEGWKTLLTALGNPKDLSLQVSIGDVAKSNGVQDALWCCRCIPDRRFVVSNNCDVVSHDVTLPLNARLTAKNRQSRRFDRQSSDRS